MISATEIDIRTEGEIAPQNYLSDHSVRSWLLTTDHKRIGILYLCTIIIFFFIASVAAALMRIELLTPQGDLVTSETYNKLFTIHGVLMIWFFLIPSIPAVLGKANEADKLNRMLQEIAWDAVTSHPQSGVTAERK